MTGRIHSFETFGAADGPGVRFVVFLSGCPLRCAYCHNPETQRMCIGCGRCVPLCPAKALSLGGANGAAVLWDEKKCVQCDSCIRACPEFAAPKIRFMEAAEVFEEWDCLILILYFQMKKSVQE